jgi:hypothetical protein
MSVREETPQISRQPIFVYAVRDARDLLTWLLGWGAAVEVLGPPELRAALAREALAMFVRHAETGASADLSLAAPAPDTPLSGARPHAGVEVESGRHKRRGRLSLEQTPGGVV